MVTKYFKGLETACVGKTDNLAVASLTASFHNPTPANPIHDIFLRTLVNC